MPTSVKLQDMESYSLILTIIALTLIALPIVIFLIYKLINRTPRTKVPKPKPVPVIHYDPMQLKSMYLEKIKEIETRYRNNLIDLRQAHLDLSKTVREYCAKASGVPTDKFTLGEIARLGKPTLFQLIREFYEPEFAYGSDKDINDSFRNAWEVVRVWA